MKKKLFLALCIVGLSKLASAQCSTSYMPVNNCSDGDQINDFSLAGVPVVVNNGCGSNGYDFFSSPVFSLEQGATYPWTATVGSGLYPQAVAIWIDLDNNGIFEDVEMLANSPSGFNHSSNITIPMNTTAASNVRMRVRCANAGTGSPWFDGTKACTDNVNSYGETEDYLVNITCATLSLTIAGSTSVSCAGDPVTLQAMGAENYSWSDGVLNDVVFFPTTTTTYSVVGSTNGCTTNTVSEFYTITINQLPAVTASTTNSLMCFGVSTTLNGSGALTYTWTGGVTDGVAFVPSITDTYTVTGSDVNGCVNTATQIIMVNQLPNVTANTTNSVVCGGGTTTLYGGGALTYTWSSGVVDGVPFNVSVTDTYTVIGEDANGCTNTATQLITTASQSTTITASASSSVVCFGGSTTLSGGGALTYTWTGGVADGVAFTPTVTDTYTVIGLDANGCTNTATQLIVVNQLPNVTANTTNSAVCIGGTTMLFGGGANTYTWTGGVTDGVAFNSTISDTYTVIGTDGNGCENTATQLIIINQLPDVTASASSSIVCNGTSTTLYGAGANTYTWSDGVFDGVAFTPVSDNTYLVTGTDTNGCQNTATQAITVIQAPTVTANVTNSSFCIGGSTTLTGSGAVNYYWTGGITDGVAFTPTVTETYTLTGVDGNGCSNKTTQLITVNQLPVLMVMTTNTLLCSGTTATLTVMGADTYTWSTAEIADNISVSPTITETYTVDATDLNGCTNTTTFTQDVTICTGINTLEKTNNPIVIYPNPNNGSFVVKSDKEETFIIINDLGQAIKTLYLTSVSNYIVEVNGLTNGVYFMIGKGTKSKLVVTQ